MHMLDSDTLIQNYLEGTLSDAEAEQLHELLKAHPELGEKMIQHFEMDAMLRATKPLTANNIIRPALLPKRRFTFATVTSVAAMAACIALLGAWIAMSWLKSDVEDTTASVAVLTRGVNLEWESAAITPGTPLSPGLLKLKSGIAQIEFYQGARVLIEGPAELQLISSGEATCTRGKLSANVPPQAKGFRINTPKGTIVDLGTEFGLDVSDASAEVHVFKGEVELHQAAESMKSLKEGQAMAFAAESQMLPANLSNFASLSDLDSRTAVSDRTQLDRWRAASDQLNADPALKLHFNFQDTDQAIAPLQENLVAQHNWLTYAICIDRNGYVPTHNRRFSQPLTGNEKVDFVNNRTKRVFDDPVGKRCGTHRQPFLLQTYRRDTGEVLHDISAPIYVKGRHWGGFRIGYQTAM